MATRWSCSASGRRSGGVGTRLGVAAVSRLANPGRTARGILGGTAGALYLGLAGLRHVAKRGKNAGETVATWTDLLVFGAVTTGIVAALAQSSSGWRANPVAGPDPPRQTTATFWVNAGRSLRRRSRTYSPLVEADKDVLVRRVPPTQPAVLMVFVCAIAAYNVYGHPVASLRALTLAVAAGLVCLVITGMRMHLLADDEGVAVRFVRSEEWLPWEDVGTIEVVRGVRGSATVRIHRVHGRHLDVPPSLLQPARPTNVVAAQAQLRGVVRQLEEIRDHRRTARPEGVRDGHDE